MKIKNIIFAVILAFVVQTGNGQERSETPKLLPITGQNAQFTADGNHLIYHSKDSEIRSMNTEDFNDELIVKSGSLFVLDRENIRIKERDGEYEINIKTGLTSKNTDLSNSITAWATNDLRSIIVLNKGKEKIIQPKGDHDYINVSLSPDRSKIIFRTTGLGSFICDLDGNILKELKDAEFPSWVSNSKVIYSVIKDNGYEYLLSDLYIEEINNGLKVCLTENTDLIPLYPSINKSGTKVVFSTPENEIYLMKIF